MTLTDIQSLLHQNSHFLEDAFGVKKIGVFGSYARATEIIDVSDINSE